MQTSKSIYDDLDIDTTSMMSDPKGFSSLVHEAGNYLLGILDESTSLSNSREKAIERAKNNTVAKTEADAYLESYIEKILDEAENVSVDQLYHMMEMMYETWESLKVAFEQRASADMIRNSSTVQDKRLAFHQYKKLREAFNAFREFMKIMEPGHTIIPLKPKTGNYSTPEKRKYPAYRVGKEVYMNYRAVGRLIKCPVALNSNQDLIDYLEENPQDDIEVVEVEL